MDGSLEDFYVGAIWSPLNTVARAAGHNDAFRGSNSDIIKAGRSFGMRGHDTASFHIDLRFFSNGGGLRNLHSRVRHHRDRCAARGRYFQLRIGARFDTPATIEAASGQ